MILISKIVHNSKSMNWQNCGLEDWQQLRLAGCNRKSDMGNSWEIKSRWSWSYMTNTKCKEYDHERKSKLYDHCQVQGIWLPDEFIIIWPGQVWYVGCKGGPWVGFSASPLFSLCGCLCVLSLSVSVSVLGARVVHELGPQPPPSPVFAVVFVFCLCLCLCHCHCNCGTCGL